MNVPAHLLSDCSSKSDTCRDPNCPNITKQNETNNRWYITMGHVQFNSRSNNFDGYVTPDHAIKVVRSTLLRQS